MRKNNVSGIRSLIIPIGTLFILIFTMFGISSGQEKSGEVLRQLEKKDNVPKQMRSVIIQQKEEKPKQGKEEKPQQSQEGDKYFIKWIRVEGATILDSQTIRDIIQSAIPPVPNTPVTLEKGDFVVNRNLSLYDMNQIAEDITAKYRKLGYILAYAVLPQQEISEGKLEVKVTEGKVGTITVKGNKHYNTAFIQKHLEKVAKEKSPKGDDLERPLYILNDYPSLNIKTQLKSGAKPGTADIVLDVQDSIPISGSLSYDNFGATTTSKNRLSASLNIGNIATDGDNLMLRGLTGLDSIDTNKLFYGKAEYVIPINYYGSKLGVYYSNAVYRVGEEYVLLDMKGKTDVAGIYVSHPVIRKPRQTLEVKLGFDYEDLYDYMLDNMRSKDKIRTFTLGANYDFADGFYGRNITNVTYYHGVRDFLGGSGQNDPDVSRYNADGEYNKYTFDFTRAQQLPGYNHILLKASGQYSADSLFVAQQFMSGGAWSVRGFKPSSLSGDSGYLLSVELYLSPLYPETKIFNQKLGDTLKFVIFADNGGVYKNNTQPGEDKAAYQTSLGLGLRLYYSKYFSFRLDWAVPNVGGSYEAKNSETYFQVTTSF